MNIIVLGLTNPDVNLKRIHQLYNVIWVSKLFGMNKLTLLLVLQANASKNPKVAARMDSHSLDQDFVL